MNTKGKFVLNKVSHTSFGIGIIKSIEERSFECSNSEGVRKDFTQKFYLVVHTSSSGRPLISFVPVGSDRLTGVNEK